MSKKEVVVSNVSKEHDNPIAELVQVACQFDSNITLESDNRRINAKSIMGIMGEREVNIMSKKPEVKSSVAKAAEAMANEVKAFAAAKEPEVKEEPKKEVVKEIVEGAAEVKGAAAKAGKKAAAKVKKTAVKAVKEKVQPKVILEFYEHNADLNAVVDRVKSIYVADGHRESSIKSMQVYIKPEENSAYYVINDKINGRIDLF